MELWHISVWMAPLACQEDEHGMLRMPFALAYLISDLTAIHPPLAETASELAYSLLETVFYSNSKVCMRF